MDGSPAVGFGGASQGGGASCAGRHWEDRVTTGRPKKSVALSILIKAKAAPPEKQDSWREDSWREGSFVPGNYPKGQGSSLASAATSKCSPSLRTSSPKRSQHQQLRIKRGRNRLLPSLSLEHHSNIVPTGKSPTTRKVISKLHQKLNTTHTHTHTPRTPAHMPIVYRWLACQREKNMILAHALLPPNSYGYGSESQNSSPLD